ncbi:MAG: nickel pincer cofactor biosynthesis protein LarC [Gammaproteobacteria bacterium]|nr:nickel pincer cofactor biosynthesis protein LarC [Gammaproteobacteria bacterium]
MPNDLLYECFSGIAGDMHLGGMLELGVPLEHLDVELTKLGLDGEYRIEVERRKKMGIAGTHVSVNLENSDTTARGLTEIRNLIGKSALSVDVKTRAISMFELLAHAEAQVHAIAVEKVHFHEVGAIDAIVDIVGAAICLEYISPTRVYCSNVELGSGMVKCAHGLMPVPAPATALLLEGCPTTRGHVDGEATTPTGATILAHAVDHWGDPGIFKSSKTAYGVGTKDFRRPNVVRMSIGEVDSRLETEMNICIECNIDDMTPEAYEPLSERLFSLGAKDVYSTPIAMKKTRPGTKLSVLAAHSLKQEIIDCILQNSTTIGVRAWSVEKSMLPRNLETVVTSLGEVRVKIVTLPDGSKRWKAEHDDVSAIAQQRNLSYLAARAEIDRAIDSYMDDSDGH